MEKTYKNFIFTKHALERIKDRTITQDAIWQTVNYPDQKKKSGKGTTKFMRTINQRLIHVVATPAQEKHHWLIVSVWVRGEEDKPALIWQIISSLCRLFSWLMKRLFKKKVTPFSRIKKIILEKK